ncbi:MAG: alpha/beta fold hydrolase [Rubrobacter sp.]|nr:alpha/beta fold hydrolase [Rubrobacter sp.]
MRQKALEKLAGSPRALRAAAVAALAIPLAASAFASVGAYVASRRVTVPALVEERYVTPWELGLRYEEILFHTSDGLALRGWWMAREGAARTIVTLAGHNGAKHHTVGIASALWARGANVLLFDNRARGESEGETTSLGYFEQLDAAAAVEYALSRSESPLGLFGFSMGGAVALMTAARDERVGAVVADSAFASQRGLLGSKLRGVMGPLSPLAIRLMQRILPYELQAVAPIREVAEIAPRGCMFVHGDADETTDPNDSRALYAAASEPKGLWILPGAGHCGAYFVDRVRYVERVSAFLEERL